MNTLHSRSLCTSGIVGPTVPRFRRKECRYAQRLFRQTPRAHVPALLHIDHHSQPRPHILHRPVATAVGRISTGVSATLREQPTANKVCQQPSNAGSADTMASISYLLASRRMPSKYITLAEVRTTVALDLLTPVCI